MTSNKALVLVGGTGGLGLEVAKGLVTAKGFDKAVALVRPSASDDKIGNLRDIGWVVEKVDFDDANALAEMVSLETKIIDAAKSSGASLFVPSQFGVDTRRWIGDFPVFQGKAAVLAHAEEVGLPSLSYLLVPFPT